MALTPDQEIEYLELRKRQAMADSATPAEPSAPPPGFDVPSPFKELAQGATMPGRGLRGLAVTAQQLLSHPTQPANALNVGAQAVQPGFKPDGFGQGAASFVAGFGDPLNKIGLPGGTVLKSLLGGAASAGGMNFLDQAAQGHVNLPELEWSAGAGGTVGMGVHGLGKGLQYGANKFVDLFPEISESLMSIPKRVSEWYKANPNVMKGAAPTAEARARNVTNKAWNVGQSLNEVLAGAKTTWGNAAEKAGASDDARTLSRMKDIPGNKIADAIDAVQKQITERATNRAKIEASYRRQGFPEEKITKALSDLDSAYKGISPLKTLLNIRQSIDRVVNPPPGMIRAFAPQEKGLSQLRQEVNGMIENLPGGDIIRNADEHVAPIYDLVSKLQDNFKRPGESVAFLKKTLSGEGDNAEEDLMHLIALEKLSGKPIINELTDAMAKASFAPALADNKIKRSLAGASPFLISALLRMVKIPFQASLPLAAAISTVGQSPAALGGILRAAQNAEPTIQKTTKGLGVAGLNAIRQLMGANQ